MQRHEALYSEDNFQTTVGLSTTGALSLRCLICRQQWTVEDTGRGPPALFWVCRSGCNLPIKSRQLLLPNVSSSSGKKQA